MRRGETRPEVAEALFAAAVDAVVGPIDTGSGFLIVRVNRIRFPESLPLSQVRDRVEALLKREKGKDLAVIKAYEAHTKASASKDVSGACAPYGIAPVETGWTSGDAKGDPVPPAVVQEALLLPANEVGPVKTVGDAHYLFKVTAKEDSRIPPLSEVREKVAAAVYREKKRAAAKGELEKILSESATAAELERKARNAGLTVSSTGFFSPLSGPYPEGIPETADIRKILLSLSKKAPVHGKSLDASGRFLALAFQEEQLAGEKEWAAKRDVFLRGAAEQKKNQLIEAFLALRRSQAKVEIHPRWEAASRPGRPSCRSSSPFLRSVSWSRRRSSPGNRAASSRSSTGTPFASASRRRSAPSG
jgi:hypothetical protein